MAPTDRRINRPGRQMDRHLRRGESLHRRQRERKGEGMEPTHIAS
jgi:hypothetical protein